MDDCHDLGYCTVHVMHVIQDEESDSIGSPRSAPAARMSECSIERLLLSPTNFLRQIPSAPANSTASSQNLDGSNFKDVSIIMGQYNGYLIWVDNSSFNKAAGLRTVWCKTHVICGRQKSMSTVKVVLVFPRLSEKSRVGINTACRSRSENLI